jgi:hypothetical protein
MDMIRGWHVVDVANGYVSRHHIEFAILVHQIMHYSTEVVVAPDMTMETVARSIDPFALEILKPILNWKEGTDLPSSMVPLRRMGMLYLGRVLFVRDGAKRTIPPYANGAVKDDQRVSAIQMGSTPIAIREKLKSNGEATYQEVLAVDEEESLVATIEALYEDQASPYDGRPEFLCFGKLGLDVISVDSTFLGRGNDRHSVDSFRQQLVRGAAYMKRYQAATDAAGRAVIVKEAASQRYFLVVLSSYDAIVPTNAMRAGLRQFDY